MWIFSKIFKKKRGGESGKESIPKKKQRTRKQKKIGGLEDSSIDILKTLALTGVLSELQISENFDSNLTRNLTLKDMITLKKMSSENRTLPYYHLSNNGKTFVKKNLLKHNKLYIREVSDAGVLHDLKLSDIYLSLCSEERKTWITPKVIRERLDSSGRKELPENDGAYTSKTGLYTGVEVKAAYPHHHKPKELKITLQVYDDKIITASYTLDYYLKQQEGDKS